MNRNEIRSLLDEETGIEEELQRIENALRATTNPHFTFSGAIPLARNLHETFTDEITVKALLDALSSAAKVYRARLDVIKRQMDGWE